MAGTVRAFVVFSDETTEEEMRRIAAELGLVVFEEKYQYKLLGIKVPEITATEELERIRSANPAIKAVGLVGTKQATGALDPDMRRSN
jgi:hypothetical protein